jgi:hypothetical protein
MDRLMEARIFTRKFAMHISVLPRKMIMIDGQLSMEQGPLMKSPTKFADRHETNYS